MVKMLSIPNALPAMEPSVCSAGERPLIWAEHPVGVKLFVGKLLGGVWRKWLWERYRLGCAETL